MVVLLVLAFPLIGLAGKIVKYHGIHPLPPHNGAFCYLGVPHVHARAPSDMRGYRVLANQEHVFVGDEIALGYDGPKFGYFGPHPINLADVNPPEKLFCYLRGPHFHANQPSAGETFVSKDDVYWYVGTFPPEFERDRFNIWVNDVRAVAGYQPPPVQIGAAPQGFHLPATVDIPSPPPAPVPSVGAPPTKRAVAGKLPKEEPGGVPASGAKPVAKGTP